ncbi:uncharacterized protein LOC101042760 isoform X2 [Saimiri boliviensis]|uniref:uncharacterized protein LOC101042760 isoform X2 n=1 Tax=Saimiri boliviensis TaxID=27679 RepID=UPI00027F8611|nr:UDP-GalNAc:beta-1,3-N-acetylgalactosaminyltransferase 1 isoform X3 [Saimiri boliviensis boliviensis]XP_039336119.1 UDP-GalNAc:beta-1,3-N-acetylgalactosaminyltransferase 1 isoform X3 [Saimiri boliviensis boliviensis]
MQGDPEDPESVPSGRAGLRAQDARPRPQRVVCARSAVRAPAGRVRVCARRERRTPSRFRAGCALCSGGRYPCLRLPAAVQPRSNPVATRGVCSGAEEEDANGVNECLRLGGDCFVGKTTIKEGIAKSCVFFCFQSNSQQI